MTKTTEINIKVSDYINGNKNVNEKGEVTYDLRFGTQWLTGITPEDLQEIKQLIKLLEDE